MPVKIRYNKNAPAKNGGDCVQTEKIYYKTKDSKCDRTLKESLFLWFCYRFVYATEFVKITRQDNADISQVNKI